MLPLSAFWVGGGSWVSLLSILLCSTIGLMKLRALLLIVNRKGQALQFNWVFEKGGFILHPDETFSVDFAKVSVVASLFHRLFSLDHNINGNLFFVYWKIEGAVESLSREILTIQAKGDKPAAYALLEKYAKMTQPLRVALEKLENIQVWTVTFC